MPYYYKLPRTPVPAVHTRSDVPVVHTSNGDRAMLFSLDDYLQVVLPHLPPALLSPQALHPIRRLARALAPATLVGFESRLATPVATADFAIGLTPESRHRPLYAGRMSPDAPVGAPGWARFHAFAAHWTAQATLLSANISTVWLEFDVAGGGDEVPAPNAFFDIRTRDQAVAVSGLQCLLVQPLPTPIHHQLARCYAALPLEAHIFQVGAMLARPVAGVRICVYALRSDQIPDYLAQIGWRGSFEAVAEVVAPVCTQSVRLGLAVDVGAEIGPQIGLECYLDERRRPQVGPRWRAVLDHLVAQGLCTVDKRDALLAWPGCAPTGKFIWPSTVVRGLNHLKLVYGPGRPLEAKVYWGFVRQWSGSGAAMGTA